MNIEEKNLPEAEETIEDTTPVASENKKLSPAIIGGIIGGAALLVTIIVIVVIALAGGSKCDSHVDADDDLKCDNCGESYDDSEEAPEITTVNVTFNVKLDNGQALSGVKFSLSRGDNTYSFISGSDGKVTAALDPGSYAITDYENLPENCIVDTPGFKITKDSTSFDLVVIDNTPDGSVNKPFYISDTETEIALEPGQELYYNYRGSSIKYARIYTDGVAIRYNGELYEAVDGYVEVAVQPESIGGFTVFSVKNCSEAQIDTILHFDAPLGSSENPIEVTGTNINDITVNSNTTVYYSWTADKDGVLLLTSTDVRAYVSLTKILENDIPVGSDTAGTNVAYMVVYAGEKVTFRISADENVVGKEENISLDIALNVYAGTNADPVPVLKDEINLTLDPDTEIVFSGETGKTVKINDESPVGIWHDTITYTNSEGNVIEVKLLKPIFVLENNAESVNGITVTVK